MISASTVVRTLRQEASGDKRTGRRAVKRYGVQDACLWEVVICRAQKIVSSGTQVRKEAKDHTEGISHPGIWREDYELWQHRKKHSPF